MGNRNIIQVLGDKEALLPPTENMGNIVNVCKELQNATR